MNIYYDPISLPDDFPFMLSDMRLDPYYSMGESYHWHDCFELSYAKVGSGVYEIGGTRYSFGPGELMVINNVEPHRMYVGKEGMNQLVIVFNPSLIWSGAQNILDYEYIKAFVDRKAGFCNKISDDNPYFEEISSYIHQIETEFDQKQPGWQLMIKAKLLSLLTLLYRNFQSESDSDNKRRALLRLRPVIHKIEEGLGEPLSLKGMADMIHVTPQHFCVLFKETTGQTFVQYVLTKRINLVRQSLIATDNGITQIAYESGFKNLSYFNKAFQTETGVTPSAYRKMRSPEVHQDKI
ncbi:MAG: helix-turn-helix domain-containing protein [Saccharofermentanales bacterium]